MRSNDRTYRVVFHYLGNLLFALGFILFIPIFVALIYSEERSSWQTINAFLISGVLSIGIGKFMSIVFKAGNPNLIQAYLITGLSWIVISAFGALPFVLGIDASFINAYFEAMSGFTTTGITMFNGLDFMPRSIIFWRSLIQWVGGLGILTFFLAIFSHTGAAHRLFGAESHKIETSRPVPGLFNTIKILWAIYIGYTILIIFLLLVFGSGFFDSVCHSFTTLSTGGYSPYDASIAHYHNTGYHHYKAIEYVIIFGMILGGTNFLIHYRLLRREFKIVWSDLEFRYWIGFIVAFTLLILLEKLSELHSFTLFFSSFEEHLRNALFQVSSVISTTGFGTVDIGSRYFGFVAKQLFLVMMLIGGSVGSTGGGVKVLRITLLWKLLKKELFKLIVPKNSISKVVFNKKILANDEIIRVSGLFFGWMVLLLIGGMITAYFSDLNSYQSFSGMFSALGNIGPCYISVDKMISLSPVIKITYIFGMLAGRLEILPVLLLFSKTAWKR